MFVTHTVHPLFCRLGNKIVELEINESLIDRIVLPLKGYREFLDTGNIYIFASKRVENGMCETNDHFDLAHMIGADLDVSNREVHV